MQVNKAKLLGFIFPTAWSTEGLGSCCITICVHREQTTVKNNANLFFKKRTSGLKRFLQSKINNPNLSKYQNMEELILISQVQSSGWPPHMTKTVMV